MKIYKVLKDSPAMRAGTQYRAGETLRLDKNTRTKGLEKMGYIREATIEDMFDEKI